VEAYMTSLDAPQDTFPGVGGTILLVREEQAQEARRIIEESRNAPPSDETAEFDVSG
jgi:hypothetical protein